MRLFRHPIGRVVVAFRGHSVAPVRARLRLHPLHRALRHRHRGPTPTPGPILQRWGDYNSLIWDPSLTSSSGEPGLFWSVAEFSKGGTDQSTVWTQFNDALPYFIGPASNVESECNGGPGSTCSVTVQTPSGVQNGDVVLVGIFLNEPAAHPPALPDSSWTLLSASNISGAPNQISAADSFSTLTVWLAAHIFGSVANDSGSYTFKHFLNSSVELGTFLMAYRGAGQDLSKYTAYGFVRLKTCVPLPNT